jgi:hypothetical protein
LHVIDHPVGFLEPLLDLKLDLPALAAKAVVELVVEVALHHVEAQVVFMVPSARVREVVVSHKDGNQVDVELEHVAQHLLLKHEVLVKKFFQVHVDTAGVGLYEGVALCHLGLLVARVLFFNISETVNDTDVAIDEGKSELLHCALIIFIFTFD